MVFKIFPKVLWVSLIASITASCACNRPDEIRPVRREDKQLTCKDVVLEINETEYLRKKAEESRGISADQILLPLCWMPTYLAGQETVKAADERLEYLGQIYDLLNCGAKARTPVQTLPPPPPIRSGSLPPMQRRMAPPPPQPGNLPPRYSPVPAGNQPPRAP